MKDFNKIQFKNHTTLVKEFWPGEPFRPEIRIDKNDKNGLTMSTRTVRSEWKGSLLQIETLRWTLLQAHSQEKHVCKRFHI